MFVETDIPVVQDPLVEEPVNPVVETLTKMQNAVREGMWIKHKTYGSTKGVGCTLGLATHYAPSRLATDVIDVLNLALPGQWKIYAARNTGGPNRRFYGIVGFNDSPDSGPADMIEWYERAKAHV